MIKMILVLAFLTSYTPLNDDIYMLDFSKKNKNDQNWSCINDGVMGGLSIGQVDYTKNELTFSGSISLENNGGFASVRSPFGQYDLSAYSTITIRYKAQGQSFALMFEDDNRYYMPYFKQNFYDINTNEGEWQETTLNLNEFEAHSFGRALGNYLGEKNLENIIRFGIITNSKNTGPFQLDIDYIKFE